MTTVAWDGKTLAADRQTTDCGAVFRLGSKITPVPGGFIACAGKITDIHKLTAWVKAGMRGKPPASEDGVDGVLVKGGKVYYVESSTFIERDRQEKIATGSGWMWAMAAMDHGKTAAEAVAYACTRDNGTGGGVDQVQPFKRPA
jgi:hypothetical protein